MRKLNKNNIVLVGCARVGKTTFGRCLSERLGFLFFDTDIELEKVYCSIFGVRKSIVEIYTDHGSLFFRRMEEHVLSLLFYVKGAVISTGGGMFLSERNRHVVKKIGKVMCLTRDIKELEHCICKKPPVSMQGVGIKKVINQRLESFRLISDMWVDVSGVWYGQ